VFIKSFLLLTELLPQDSHAQTAVDIIGCTRYNFGRSD